MSGQPAGQSQSTFGRVPLLAVWLAALLALIVTGYLAFRAFVTAPEPGALNLYLLAAFAGVASFFSPCAFPLLPSYLSVYTMAADGERARPRGALVPALAAALGVVTFDLLLGALIGALGAGAAAGLSISADEPNAFVQGFRGLVGLVLLALGVGQVVGWNLKPRLTERLIYQTRPARQGGRGPVASLYLYGLGYTAAGMGCTGPILAGLMVLAASSGGFTTALVAFGLFALTMGALMLIVSALVASSRKAMIQRLKALTPRIESAAGVLLILVGAFNLYTALNQAEFLRLLFP